MDHDHLPALSALLFSAPVAMIALAGLSLAAARGSFTARVALERASATPSTTKLAALLLMFAGAIHLGLVPGHLDEHGLAAAFAIAGAGLLVLAAAALLRLSRWRPLAAASLLGVLVAYAATRIAGPEQVDALGIATASVELVALALVVSPSAIDRLATERTTSGS